MTRVCVIVHPCSPFFLFLFFFLLIPWLKMAEDCTQKETRQRQLIRRNFWALHAKYSRLCVDLYLDGRMETVCQNDENIMVDYLRGTCWPRFSKFPTNFANESLARPAAARKVHFKAIAYATYATSQTDWPGEVNELSDLNIPEERRQFWRLLKNCEDFSLSQQ